MKIKIDKDVKLTLQGIIISGLLGIIATFLGFIFLFVFKLYSNSVNLNTNVATLTVKVDNQAEIQTALLENQYELQRSDIEQDEHISTLYTEFDTIMLSVADLRRGFINHEGRIIKLEKYYNENH